MSPKEGMIVYSVSSVAERSDLVSRKSLCTPGNSSLLSKFIFEFLADHGK